MKRLLIPILMLISLSLHAQKSNFWQKVNNTLTVVKNIDTTYIYHPKQSFTLGVFTTLQQAGFHLNVNFKIYSDEYPINGETQYTIQEKLSSKLGLELGYGKLALGYGFEVGPKSAYKKKAFAFGLIGKSWGVHFNYFKINNPFQSSLIMWDEQDDDYMCDIIIPKEHATLNSLAIEGYYIFNNKKFFYPATYKACLVQRRTAGSWIVAGRYMQGGIYNSPTAAFDSYNLLDCFSTLQVSLGGGYSGNIVCWHKDPKNSKDKGLRNITINITAMPVLTVVNYLKTYLYQFDDNEYLSGLKISKIFCYPIPNFIANSALGITLDRFFISAQFTYNYFFYHSSSAFNAKKLQIPDYVDDISFHGSFHDWNMKILFTYKF